jgi:hypothetical protein
MIEETHTKKPRKPRTRKASGEIRTAFINVRLTHAERAAAGELSKKLNKTVSDILRSSLYIEPLKLKVRVTTPKETELTNPN